MKDYETIAQLATITAIASLYVGTNIYCKIKEKRQGKEFNKWVGNDFQYQIRQVKEANQKLKQESNNLIKKLKEQKNDN